MESQRPRISDIPQSGKKQARKKRREQKAAKRLEKAEDNSTDSKTENNSIDSLRKHIEGKAESSHLPDLSHEQLDLKTSIDKAKQELSKILENEKLSIKDSIMQQIQTIQKFPKLMDSISEHINYINENEKYLSIFDPRIYTDRRREFLNGIQEIYQNKIKLCIELFHPFGKDFNTHLPKEYQANSEGHSKSSKILTVKGLLKEIGNVPELRDQSITAKQHLLANQFNEFILNPVIIRIMTMKELINKQEWQGTIEKLKNKFKEVIYKNNDDVKKAYGETLSQWPKECGTSPLKTLGTAYLEQIRYNSQNSDLKVDMDTVLSDFQKALDNEEKQQEQKQQEDEKIMVHSLNTLRNLQSKLSKKRVDANLNEITKLADEEIGNILENEENKNAILEEGLNIATQFIINAKKSPIIPYETVEFFSLYDFLGKTLKSYLLNSLSELEKKEQEALRLLEEDIKKHELLHSQKQSEQSDQPQIAMEKPSPADTPPNDLEASLEDTNITPERKHIVLSYLDGLFKKSHLQSFDDKTIIKTFLEENIDEAKEVATYIEQKDFFRHKIRDNIIKFAVHLSHERGFFKDTGMTPERRHIAFSYLFGLFEKSHPQSFDDDAMIKTFLDEKNIEEAKQIVTYIERSNFYYKTQDDVIRFAIYLKYEHGFPLDQAGINEKFDIVRLDHSKGSSSSTSELKITRGGKILKDGKVQRVYLIGLQDSSETSSSDAQPKPMVLLAMQSTETGYPKYGAGTPLPTGGVVDVATAQNTTRDQANLYKATLAIEMLQETHEQKEVDLSTLELFDTEIIMKPHTKVPFYDVVTFVGKVKGELTQALPEKPKQGKAYQETTGACMVELDHLLSAVKQELTTCSLFLSLSVVKRSIKRQIAIQVLGDKDQVPTLAQKWIDSDARRWSDFGNSTAMDDLAEYIMMAYREELGLTSNK